MRRAIGTACLQGVVVALLAALPARALQPLDDFVTAARLGNPDVLEARANAARAQAQADVALGRQLPSVSARASYARNQYKSQIALPGVPQPIELVPKNQWDGSAALTVPLIDLASFQRIAAARTGAEGSKEQLEANRLRAEAIAAQDYYQLVADLALVLAARTSLEVARENGRTAEWRLRSGDGTTLEVDRARAEIEQRIQQLASSELQVALAARALESDSGVSPDIATAPELVDDLHPEPPLSFFEEGLDRIPSVQAAALATRAAQQEVTAEQLSFLPSIAGAVAERGTSAPGLIGHDWTWQAGLTATWTFDFSMIAGVRSAGAGADAAQARQRKNWLAARDAVYGQWNAVVADLARSRSARAGLEAARHAALTARKSYGAGTVNQLDLLQAERDAFNAEVARIETDADLMNARAQLRLAAGQTILESQDTRRMQ